MPFKFKELKIPGLMLVEPEVHGDDRGFFVEIFKNSEFINIPSNFAQVNHSKSAKGVLRGLHYQLNPKAQGKLVRVLEGKIFDVAVDVRKNSKFYGRYESVELDSESMKMLYIPEGFAHGFCVVSDVAQIEYFCTNVYSPGLERGIIYNDPDLAIKWPIKDPVLSGKDREYPFFKNIDTNFVYK